jgi:hypothetical protein
VDFNEKQSKSVYKTISVCQIKTTQHHRDQNHSQDLHIKNLKKPYHGSTYKIFSSNFQNQGGDANNFDYSEDKDKNLKDQT